MKKRKRSWKGWAVIDKKRKIKTPDIYYTKSEPETYLSRGYYGSVNIHRLEKNELSIIPVLIKER